MNSVMNKDIFNEQWTSSYVLNGATSEISCRYVNIYKREIMYRVYIERMEHSSFVVFYFVFVLWLFPDVSRGTVFYSNAL